MVEGVAQKTRDASRHKEEYCLHVLTRENKFDASIQSYEHNSMLTISQKQFPGARNESTAFHGGQKIHKSLREGVWNVF